MQREMQLTRSRQQKPICTIRPAIVPAGGFIIREGWKEDRYACREFDSPLGRAFHVEKQGPRGGDGHVYDVLIAADPRECQCDCLGFLQHGHCRHVDGLRALLGPIGAAAASQPTRHNTADLDHF
jgi:hypothetical protein